MTEAVLSIATRLAEALAQASITVLSQMQGNEWKRVEATSSDERKVAIGVQLDGAVTASFTLNLPYSSAIFVVGVFLGETPGTTATQEFGAEQIEVVQEFVRQVLGLAVSQLRPAFGPLTPTIVAISPDSDSMETATIEISAGTTPLTLELKISETHSKALRERESKLLQPPPPEPPPIDEVAPVKEPPPAVTTISTPLDSEPPLSIDANSKAAKYLRERNFDLLLDIELQVMLRFGRREMLLKDILNLSSGSVVELDRLIHEPVDVILDHRVVARGEVVIVEGNYGVRISEVASPQQRLQCLC